MDKVFCVEKNLNFIFCFHHASPREVKMLKANTSKIVKNFKGSKFTTNPIIRFSGLDHMEYLNSICLQMKEQCSHLAGRIVFFHVHR